MNCFVAIALFFNNESNAQTPQWGNWGRLQCYEGLEARVKNIGYNKYGKKYEWIAQVKNTYGKLVHFDMSWTVSGEKIGIGRFSVQPGNISNAVSYYFNSNTDELFVGISQVCFGENWLSCAGCYYADCDIRPGVPNQQPCNTAVANTNTNNTYNNTNSNNQNSNTYTEPSKNNSSSNNDDCNYHALRCNKKDCPCPNHNKTTANTNTKPLTPQEIQQQQQYAQQVQQQQQLAAQKDEQQRYLQASQREWDRKLQQQRDELEKQKARQAYADQVNDAVNQKAITNIQNTPITKLEVNKVDIKEVKKEPASGIDKATVAGIVESGKYEMEFPELLGNDEKRKKVCSDMVDFRDNKLLTMYSKELDKYILNQNSLDYVAKLKKDVFEDSKWALSDAGHSVAALSNVIKTACDLISDVAGFNLEIKNADDLLFLSTWKAKDALEFFKTEENIYKFFSGDEKGATKILRDMLLDRVLKKFNPVKVAIKTTLNLGENLVNQKKIEIDYKELKNEVRNAFDNIDIEIARYNKAMLASMEEFKKYNEIKEAIDIYLSANCKPDNDIKLILH